MPTISPAYRALNAELHAGHASYGAHGGKAAKAVRVIAADNGFKSILDYGCGKGGLKAALPDLNVAEYDPAIAGKDNEPRPAQLVVCTDVLEHVERSTCSYA